MDDMPANASLPGIFPSAGVPWTPPSESQHASPREPWRSPSLPDWITPALPVVGIRAGLGTPTGAESIGRIEWAWPASMTLQGSSAPRNPLLPFGERLWIRIEKSQDSLLVLASPEAREEALAMDLALETLAVPEAAKALKALKRAMAPTPLRLAGQSSRLPPPDRRPRFRFSHPVAKTGHWPSELEIAFSDLEQEWLDLGDWLGHRGAPQAVAGSWEIPCGEKPQEALRHALGHGTPSVSLEHCGGMPEALLQQTMRWTSQQAPGAVLGIQAFLGPQAL